MGHRLRTNLTVVASVAATLLFVAAPAASASKADDINTARQGDFQASDFPSTWSGTRNTSPNDAQIIKIAGKVPACKQYVVVRKAASGLPNARSLEYDDGAGTTASNTVYAFPSPAKATAAVKTYSGSTIPTCLDKLTSTSIKGAQVSVSPVDVGTLGDQSIAYSGDITASDGSRAQVLSAIVRVGRFVDVYSFQTQSGSPPSDQINAAVDASITRLTTAAG